MSGEIKNLYTDTDINEENTDDILESKNEDEVAESESKALTPVVSKVKKHTEAKKLIEEAKSIVHANASELNDCKNLLENDLRDYEDAKRALHIGGLDDSKALLVELGHVSVSELEIEEEHVVFESKDEVEPMVIKDVNSGIFTGFIFSLLAGLATFIGLIYFATEKLGITLDISKVPKNETMNDILNWFSSLIGMENNIEVGIGMIAIAVLVVMLLVYIVRVGLKGGSNLRFANHQMKETQKFVTHQTNCKIEMDRVDIHINDAIKILADYQVLLNEQHGKLVRILYFEGDKAEQHGYSHTSKQDMKETQDIIENVQALIIEPMSSEGKLSDESSLALHVAKENVEKVLSKLYQARV